MNLVSQPNDYGCVCASFAMVLDKTYEEVASKLGVHSRPGFTWPEFSFLLATAGRVPVTLLPFSTVESGEKVFFDRTLLSLLEFSRAVMFVRRYHSTKSYLHAIAFDPKVKALCPRRGTININDYQISEIIATPTFSELETWKRKITLRQANGTYCSPQESSFVNFEKEIQKLFMRR